MKNTIAAFVVMVGVVSVCHLSAVVLHGPIDLAHPARSFALALVDAQFQSSPVPKKSENAPYNLRR